jgi:hypothetical protein
MTIERVRKVVSICIIGATVGVMLALATPVFAQISGATNGQPVIATGAMTATSDAAYLDAYIATGGPTNTTQDMCTRINAAWSAILQQNSTASVTVDARGFTGNEQCLESPFPSNANGGKLLLANVTIQTSVGWQIPSRVEVQGMGISNLSQNTVIKPSQSSFNSAVIELGNSLTTNYFFAAKVKDLTVSCAGASGCTGILNASAQEGSTVENVNILDAPVFGLRVSTNGANGNKGAGNSGPYRNINIQYTQNGPCSNCTPTPLQIDGPGETGGSGQSTMLRAFDAITVSGAHLHFLPTDCVYIFGVSARLENSHTETCKNGIQIGDTTQTVPTRHVIIENIMLDTGSGFDVVIGVPNPNNHTNVGDVVIEGITHANTTYTGVLQDNMSSHTLTSTNDTFLGFYALGNCGSGTCASGQPKVISTSVSVVP